MAIGTGDGVEKFGTQTAITNVGVAISDGAMSVQGDAVPWTNSDDAIDADVLLEATFLAAPGTGRTVILYCRKLNVRGANDENVPIIGSNENHNIGTFPLDASQVGQVITTRVQLPNGKSSQEYEFYLKNNGGQNISGCQAFITPIAVGPGA